MTIAGTDEDANVTGDLDILESVTINGTGASTTIIQAGTIGYPSGSANGIDRVFHIPGAGTVNFSGVTIANGKTTDDNGAGIRNNAGTLTLTNSTVSANSSEVSGGGIYYASGTVTLTNSTVTDNYAARTGGGIRNGGGTLNITNSTFSGNTAGDGGGAESASLTAR